MTSLVDQIDALLALNAKGAVSHKIPGLAVELLERAKAELVRQERDHRIDRARDTISFLQSGDPEPYWEEGPQP